VYIVFEGIVGTGKTTHSKRFASYLQQKHKDRKVIYVREPGGSEVADAIRKLVQGTGFVEDVSAVCETYLYAASRAQILRTIVGPTLTKGGIVISDRSFLTSMAYQGYARKYGIKQVYNINKHAIKGFTPDLVVYLTTNNIPEAVKRTFDPKGDRWERMPSDFFREVVKGYEMISKQKMFNNKWVTINVSTKDSIQQNFVKIISAIEEKLENKI
jgi:dTMP kinase